MSATDQHREKQRLRAYLRGWRDGAVMTAVDAGQRVDPDYAQGYADGRTTFAQAAEAARRRLGLPPASKVRAV